MTTTLKTDPLLDRFEVAELLRIFPTTVRRLEARGQLQAIRLSRKMTRYRLSSIEALATAKTQAAHAR